MKEEVRHDDTIKQSYSVRYYCPTCGREDWENDVAGAKSQHTIRASGLDVKKNRYYLAFY